ARTRTSCLKIVMI
ncbi:aldehyde dehydrogenase family protein, partial [Vibrio parahaemolyticus V-223/04]